MNIEISKDHSFFHSAMFILGMLFLPTVGAKDTEFEYITPEQSFLYTVIQTGENYTFKFNENPAKKDNNTAKLKAGYHVLRSIYKDTSINKTYSEAYIRERARCYVFDSHFYTYSLCFLPNDFSKKDKGRFWGFTTQIPNWKWLVTRILFPVLLAFALFFYVTKRKD